MQPGMSVSYVARRHGVAPSLLFAWKRRMLEGGSRPSPPTKMSSAPAGYAIWKGGCASSSACSAGRRWRTRSSKRPSSWHGQKKRPRGRARGRGRFPMKAVADTLGVARSNLVEAARGQRRPRQPYRKAGDTELLAAMRRSSTSARPTAIAGSRPCSIASVVAAASRRSTASACSASARRRPHPAGPHRPPARPHPRWRGRSTPLERPLVFGSLEIAGRDGSWSACCSPSTPATARSSAGCHHCRHLRRDGPRSHGRLRRTPLRHHRATQPVEWLSDNGSAYRAKEPSTRHRPWPAARLHAGPLARKQRHRRGVRKDPQARLCSGHPAPGCRNHSKLVAAWIEDYNTSHPHSGLRILAPRVPSRCA